MRFEWDESKNTSNKEKHGISFESAQEVFDDPFHLSVIDHRYDYCEERWISIGQTVAVQVVVVAHLYFDEEGEEHIRIISARTAASSERRQYEHFEYSR